MEGCGKPKTGVGRLGSHVTDIGTATARALDRLENDIFSGVPG